MISVLQMMSYLSLMNIYFPANFMAFLGCIESVHNFNAWFPNPFKFIFPEQNLNMTSYNSQFEERGFANRNMLYLCGSDLVLMATTGIVIILLIPIAKKISFAKTILNSLQYSSISRSFIQSYLKICIAAAINVGIVFFFSIICHSMILAIFTKQFHP